MPYKCANWRYLGAGTLVRLDSSGMGLCPIMVIPKRILSFFFLIYSFWGSSRAGIGASRGRAASQFGKPWNKDQDLNNHIRPDPVFRSILGFVHNIGLGQNNKLVF